MIKAQGGIFGWVAELSRSSGGNEGFDHIGEYHEHIDGDGRQV